MNFIVQQRDPLDEAIQQFHQFNNTPSDEREHTEEELIQLVVHQVKQSDR